jgi:hypothetical protein
MKGENLQKMNNNFTQKQGKYLKVIAAFTSKVKKLTDIFEDCEVQPDDTLETIIFKKYIELGNVAKVAEYINDQGYRIKTDSNIGQKKYIHNDISDVLNDKKVSVDKKFIRAIQDMKDIEHMIIKMNAKKLLKESYGEGKK